MYKWVSNDLLTRFRIVYIVHRILEITILKDDFYLWSLYTAVLGGATFAILYLAGRRLGFSIFASIFLVFASLIGDQSTIWWRFGMAETLGMLFLSICLFLLKPIRKYRFGSETIFYISLFLASLVKESFIIILPAMLLLKLLMKYLESEDKNLNKLLKNNLDFLIPFIFLFLVSAYEIIFKIGLNSIGYAGIDSKTPVLEGIVKVISGPILPYLIVCLILFVVYFIILMLKGRDRTKLITFGFLTSFLLLSFVPNIFPLVKIGMIVHYLNPSTFCLSLFIVYILKLIFEEFNIDSKLKLYFWGAILIIFILNTFPAVNTTARVFAQEGQTNDKLFSEFKDKDTSNDTVLILANPVDSYEDSYSLNYYLSVRMKLNVYAEPILNDKSDTFSQQLSNSWLSFFVDHRLVNLQNKPRFILFFNKSDYDKYLLNDQYHVEMSKYELVKSVDQRYILLKLKSNSSL